MSTPTMTTVMRDTDLSVGARLLWWELNQWVTPDLLVCFPTQSALSDALGVSRASIIRWTQELSDKGLIRTEREGRGIAYVLVSPD